MAKQAPQVVVVDDWEVLESAMPRRREGLFISISPGGAVRFSQDLTKLLDPKLPRCTMKYSISLSKLRLLFQREITANSHAWRNARGDTATFGAESALRAKNLLPEQVTLYNAAYYPAQGDQPPYVEVEMSTPLLVVPPRQPKKPPKEPLETSEDKTFTATCAACGLSGVTATRRGRIVVLDPHKTPSGNPCFCRRAVGNERV